MAVFTIQTPSGATLDIEAADEAGAIKGAQAYESQQQQTTRDIQPQLNELSKLSQGGLGGQANPESQAAIHDVQAGMLADKLQAGHEGSALGAGMRGAARGGTMGTLERLEAGAGALAGGVMAGDLGSIGDRYALNRDALFKVRDRERASNPVASLAGELAGGALSPIPIPGGGGAPALTAGRGLAAGAREGALTGAVYSGAQANEGHVVDDAISGGVMGGLTGGAIGGALGANAGRGARNAVIRQAPAIEALEQAATRGYQLAEQHGAIFRPGVIQQDLAPAMMQTLHQRNVGVNGATMRDNYAGVMNVMDAMGQASQHPMPLQQLEAFRRNFRDVQLTPSASDGEKAMASQMIRHIDAFMDRAEQAGPSVFIAPRPGQDPALAVQSMQAGRRSYAAARRGEELQTAVQQNIDAAGDTGFGANEQNKIKQAFGKVMRAQENKGGPFNATDMRAMQQARDSGNVGRFLGQFSPGRTINSMGPAGGLGLIGGVVGGPLAGAATAGVGAGVGWAGRVIGEGITRKAAEYAQAVVRLPRNMQDAAIAAAEARHGIPRAMLREALARMAATGEPVPPISETAQGMVR